MVFGDRLKDLRELADLKQEDMAKKLNVDRSTYGKWENNSSKPDFEKLVILAEFFEVTTDYLLCRTNDSSGRHEGYTLAAHHEGDDWTDEELEDIEMFKDLIKQKRLRNK